MGSADQLAGLDLTAQADLVRRRQVSSAELVETAIGAAEALNPTLNAIIHTRYDAARAEAAQADRALGDGPFAGVPFLVKDLGGGQEGEPMHMGNRLLKRIDFRMDHDSNLAKRFRRAGLVPIGRTNVPEFGTIISTESLAYGPCRNPWNIDHSTGGSSGGSAAAVAAGIVGAAHANDGGGSIRIPASECGLVGLKPSRGRVSLGPDFGDTWAGATIDGVVTRSVRDTAALLDQISGYESGDPYTAPPLSRPLAAEVGADPGRLRIGVLSGAGLDKPVHPECIAAVEATATLLRSLGHEVEETWPAQLTGDEFSHLFGSIVAAYTAADRAFYAGLVGRPITADDWEPHNMFMADLGDQISSTQYIHLVTAMQAWCRRLLGWWEPADASRGFDVLVTPTIATPPPKIGQISPENPDCMPVLLATMLFTAQFNSSGQPAVSLPLHWTPDGLPVGVQFVGGFAAEATLVRLAAQIEAAQPWAGRRPRVSV